VNVLMHRATFYEHATHVLEGGQLTLLDLPLDAHPALLQDQLIVYLRSDWELGGRTLPGGSLVSTPFEDYQTGERDFTEIIVPGSRETVRSRQLSRGYLLVQICLTTFRENSDDTSIKTASGHTKPCDARDGKHRRGGQLFDDESLLLCVQWLYAAYDAVSGRRRR
jgi:prolyl oligopeptidase PreP (S9A serine peptidase family)